MAAAGNGVPVKSKGEDLAMAGYARKLTNRSRAFLEQAFDLLEERRRTGKGDFVAVLAAQIEEDPLTALERIAKLLPQEPPANAGGGLSLNFKDLYLSAAQVANGHGEPARVIEARAELEPIGVQSGSGEW